MNPILSKPSAKGKGGKMEEYENGNEPDEPDISSTEGNGTGNAERQNAQSDKVTRDTDSLLRRNRRGNNRRLRERVLDVHDQNGE